MEGICDFLQEYHSPGPLGKLVAQPLQGCLGRRGLNRTGKQREAQSEEGAARRLLSLFIHASGIMSSRQSKRGSGLT